MARKKADSAQPEERRPTLLVSRSEAKQRIEERIDKGRPLLDMPMRDFTELEIAEKAQEKWSSFNVELLRTLFSTAQFAEEYAGWAGGAVYMGRDLSREVRDHHSTINDRLHRLESIRDRLELVPEAPGAAPVTAPASGARGISNRVFVVHGHDESVREATARLLERLGLEPIILHEQPSAGRTVIEKLEHNADVAFAVVALTPDDVGAAAGSGAVKPRARQNVVLELGYFLGRLGRSRVCALYKGDLELPSDFVGVVYVHLDSAGAWKMILARELKNAGHAIDMNEVI